MKSLMCSYLTYANKVRVYASFPFVTTLVSDKVRQLKLTWDEGCGRGRVQDRGARDHSCEREKKLYDSPTAVVKRNLVGYLHFNCYLTRILNPRSSKSW
jgi:hypothetical protein